jgi:hypothetical protein
LQGELTCRQAGSKALSPGGFDGMDLGVLSTNDAGDPHLVIGNRSLDGKLVKLRKPLVVTRTVAVQARKAGWRHLVDRDDDDDDSGESGAGGGNGKKRKRDDDKDDKKDVEKVSELRVVAVVRHKFVFRGRPNPIVKKRAVDAPAKS